MTSLQINYIPNGKVIDCLIEHLKGNRDCITPAAIQPFNAILQRSRSRISIEREEVVIDPPSNEDCCIIL